MKLRDLVKNYVSKNPNEVPFDVARTLRIDLTDVQMEEAVTGYLTTLAAEYRQLDANRLAREYSGVTDSGAVSSTRGGSTTTKASASPGPQPSSFMARRHDLLARLMSVPGVGMVAFGQMRVEHHNAIAEHLTGTVKGINERIVAHERAIEEIKAAGVACLDELPDTSSVERDLAALV